MLPMSSMRNKFTEYEEKVVEEMVRHELQPNWVEKTLALAGKPIDKLLKASRESKVVALRKVETAVRGGITKGLTNSILIANKVYNTDTIISKYKARGVNVENLKEIRTKRLEDMDQVAKSYNLVNALVLSTEGALLGVAATLSESIPYAQVVIPSIIIADVVASITLLSRNACQIAASYGFSSKDDENIPNILYSMAPEKLTSEKGYLANKAVISRMISKSGEYLASKAGEKITQEIIEKEAPALVKLISYVAERLGVIITEKELGLLVPVAGGVLNGGVNLAFQQNGQIVAMDYFRRKILEERFGEEAFWAKFNELKEKLQAER